MILSNRYTRSRRRTAARILVSQLSGVLMSGALLLGVGALLGYPSWVISATTSAAGGGLFVASSIAPYILFGGRARNLSYEKDLRVKSGASTGYLVSTVVSECAAGSRESPA